MTAVEIKFCGNGHEWTAETTYVRNGKRACRRCNAAAVARYKAKLRAAGRSLPRGPRNKTPRLKATWLDRFNIGLADECWPWQGVLNEDGYGKWGNRYAHRLSYEHFIGPIPTGLHIDHLCRTRSCVNPAHLEPVTVGENVRRGISGLLTKLRHAERTHCAEGHALTPANTYVRPRDAARICRECQRRICRESKRRTRAALATT